MENATKALLIAAAVLIAILIISLGLVVYTKASETVENAGDLSEYQIQQFNEKFKKYEGTSKTGTEVNAMLETVFNHNLNQADDSTCVAVKGAATVTSVTNLTSSPTKVSTGARYTVKVTYSSSSKLINQIEVSKNN